MSDYYFDTSALIKRYAVEAGTGRVLTLLQEAARVYTASIAYAELVMAFRRKQDEGTLQQSQISELIRDLDAE
ncbi:MAG: type II toxin-antitoxin system VapC family toxin [Anaerolineae bacterium]|nr:type II toxin-antitoxin system VapC family toxin [Anaerolineae bacterium]